MKRGRLLIDSDDWNDTEAEDAEIIYQDNMTELTKLMDKKNPGYYWRCTAKGLGWRNLSGAKLFEAMDARSLLDSILPNTDNHYKIYNERHGFVIINSHHDSQHEEYWVRPCSAKIYN